MSQIIALIFSKLFYKITNINGKVMGIHYDYKSTRGMKAMEKQAKREKKLAERKAKRNKQKKVLKQKMRQTKNARY